MNEAQAKLKPYELAFLQKQAAENPDCKTCRDFLEKGTYFAPNHKAGICCRSGKRPHCTCDSCF